MDRHLQEMSLNRAADRRHNAGFHGVAPTGDPSISGSMAAWGGGKQEEVDSARLLKNVMPKRYALNKLDNFVLDQGQRRHYRHRWELPLTDAEYQQQLAPLVAAYELAMGEKWEEVTPEQMYSDWAQRELGAGYRV